MKPARVLRQIAPVFAILAVMAGLCALYAVVDGDASSLSGLVLCCLVSGLMWAVPTVMLGASVPVADLPSRLGIVAIFWLVVPVVAALPFALSTSGHTAVSALFEAVSNLTTSGASVSAPDQVSESMRLWRALLQWLGGAASVSMAVAIFSDLASSAPGLLRAHKPFAVGPGLLRRAARRIATVYMGCATAAALILIIGGTDPVAAFEKAMAAVTTSSTLDNTAPLVASVPESLILTLALIFGATNIGIWSGIPATRGLWRDPELSLMCVLAIAVWLGTCLLTGSFNLALMAHTISFMTGSGLNLGSAPPLITLLPPPVPEFLALAGGAALSTTGGLKLIRLIWLSTLVRDEFGVLAVEHSPDAAPRTRTHPNDRALIHMMAFMLVIPLLLTGLCLTGASLHDALRGAIGALTSHGPLMADYLDADSSAVSLCLLGLGCVAGRVELLALVPLLGVIRWPRRTPAPR